MRHVIDIDVHKIKAVNGFDTVQLCLCSIYKEMTNKLQNKI